MSETAAGGLGAVAGKKLVLLGLPIAITLVAWVLGLRLFPPRKGREVKDMLDRLLACGVSSFVVGLPALLVLLKHAPSAFAGAQQLAIMAGVDPFIGFISLVGCVLLLSSLPGPWIVVAWVLWFQRRKGKDIGQMAADASDDWRRAMRGKDQP
jgi:hypothetical protein